MSYSKAASAAIGAKMRKMKGEAKKRPHPQMLAIALSEARKSGFKIPKKPGSKN